MPACLPWPYRSAGCYIVPDLVAENVAFLPSSPSTPLFVSQRLSTIVDTLVDDHLNSHP